MSFLIDHQTVHDQMVKLTLKGTGRERNKRFLTGPRDSSKSDFLKTNYQHVCLQNSPMTQREREIVRYRERERERKS